MTTDYRVQLDAFEGPLDLLLHLIRRAEVDITDIPIATIADQYMAHLTDAGGIARIDIDVAGEFLVMAATLMEIKSRMIQPVRPEGATGDGFASPVLGESATAPGEDPRAELVRQLLAYKKFRDASHILEVKKATWERRFPSARAGVDSESLQGALAAAAEDVDLEDVSLVDLVEAFTRIAAAVNFDRLGEHTITYDDTPIELHAEDILDRLRREADRATGSPPSSAATRAEFTVPRLPLASLFSGRTRAEMLGLFLATLELVRRRAIAVRQDTPGGEIMLELRPEEPAADRAPETEAAT
ncbi:MAG: segregation/condensation protein A [Phycisphaerales bacterium]